MKIAIMLSGQPRFNREFSDLLENLRNYDQMDLFLHLWNSDASESVYIPPTWPKDIDAITMKIHQNIPKKARIAEMRVLPQVPHEATGNYNLTPWSNPRNIWYTYYGIKQVNQMRESYEKLHGEYDLVIKARPDAGLRDPLDCCAVKSYLDQNPNVVIMPNDRRFGMQGPIVNDLIGIGLRSTMGIYCAAVDHFEQYNSQGCLYHGETLLARHLVTNNIEFPQTDIICTFREHWYEHNRPDYGVWI
jgi:hypothetical protein